LPKTITETTDPFYSEITMTLQDFPRQEGNGMEAANEAAKQRAVEPEKHGLGKQAQQETC
jgi:hypothetical protein